MDTAVLTIKLRERLTSVLQNPSIDEPSLAESVNDTVEIIGNREVPGYLTLDIAIFRYKIRQKIHPSETEQKLYDNAYKKVLSYPIIEDGTALTQATTIKAGSRVSEWDL